MRLAWPEKITLALFALITICMFWLTSGDSPATSEYCRILQLQHPTWTAADSYCFISKARRWADFGQLEWLLSWKFVLPAWAVARVVDLMAGGPARRRASRESVPSRVTADVDLRPGEWSSR